MKVKFIAETEEMIRAVGMPEPPKKKIFCKWCGRPQDQPRYGGGLCRPVEVMVGPGDVDVNGWWVNAEWRK